MRGMTEDSKRRGGGAKPSRTETVTVRLDPKLRYLADLAARKQRRTLSSFIEWAVQNSLDHVKLYEGDGYNGNESVSVAEAASSLWDVDEAERFVRLAIRYPELLTHEEQERWKMLHDSGLLEQARGRNARTSEVLWDWAVLEDRVFPTLRRRWAGLLEAQAGGLARREAWIHGTREDIEADGAVLSWVSASTKAQKPAAKKGGADDIDMDDEIPF